MIKKLKLIGLIVLTITMQSAFGQVDNYDKNKKLFDEEQERFEKELISNKDSAEVYWKHANITANFTFNAYKDAWKHYEKALSIDTSKVIYFIDYGKYLYEVLGVLDYANKLYERGLKIFPENEELKNGLDKVTKSIAKIEENIKLASFGKAPTKGLLKAEDYSKVTDFENLQKQTTNKNSQFYYKTLIEKFNSGVVLTQEQVYMLLIGFTLQDGYKPHTKEGYEVYQLNSEEKFDEAIQKAKDLLATNPLMPELYEELIYANRKKGEFVIADNYQKRLQSILNAMLYSGEGTCAKPYVTLWINAEYSLLKYLDYKRTGTAKSNAHCDHLSDKIEVTNMLTNNQTEIYFNITLMLEKAMEN